MTQRAPLLGVALALIAGIAAQHWLSAVSTVVWWWIMAATALLVGIVVVAKRQLGSWLFLVSLWMCVMAVGATLGRSRDPLYAPAHWSRCITTQERPLSVDLRLTTTPMPRERSYMAKAEVINVDGQPACGDINVYFKKESATRQLRYGDRLQINTHMGGDRRILYTTSNHYSILERDSTSLRARSEAIRLRLLRRMQRGPLVPRETAVAEAVTLGWRADLEPETRDAFRNAGIAHLLAVSGLHVGLVAGMLGVLCFAIPRERKGRMVRGVVQLIGVWGFTMLTGSAPSTVRAALMFSLFIVSDILGRRTPKLNLLAATAVITLASRPMLLFDVGWQLSYSAVAGILIARPVIVLWRNLFWRAATVSTSATLATMPVTLAVFHRIQPWFLIANVVIVPLAGVILALSLAYMAVPCHITAWMLHWPLVATGWLTNHISMLPMASVEISEPQPWLLVVLSAAVIAMLLAARSTKITS